ncbi:MAG: thioredoxin family protein [Leptospira sp.]|nr:thioredoxin family protein [Leptospira sp.]NCS93267.1 thioredoxin family protein [Leptospira sp.]
MKIINSFSLSSIFIILIAFIQLQNCKEVNENAKTTEIYLESLNYARDKNVKLLLVFGADWCKDCHSLKDRFRNNQKISTILSSNFVVFNVDVGKFDKNLEFAKNFGSPQDNGIPSLVIIDPAQNDKILGSTKGGEFSNASNMDDDSIENYLTSFIK